MAAQTIEQLPLAALMALATVGLVCAVRGRYWSWRPLMGSLGLSAFGAVITALGLTGIGLVCLAAAVASFIAAFAGSFEEVPQSARWRRKGSAHLVYILRDSDGLPLYWGKTVDFQQRIAQHMRGQEPWRRRIDRYNSMPVRWVRSASAATRIERRRIRCARVASGWRLCPPPFNRAEVTSGRVWFPRAWTVVYACESLVFRRARWLQPLTATEPSDGPTGEPTGGWSGPLMLEASYVRPPDRTGAAARPGEGERSEPRPGSRHWGDGADNADADLHTPTGCVSHAADAPVPADRTAAGQEAFLSALSAALGVADGSLAPTGAPDTPRGSQRPSRGSARRQPKHDEKTRARWKATKAAQRSKATR